ncbi:hypothetical protein ACH5RR_019100 [Cinchona calisaya]|uniref:Uncharacterized protein n=1 Tax=Cinchona calisaya TaxID=153742 RepID=A0ABD2ZNG5_9GENT
MDGSSFFQQHSFAQLSPDSYSSISSSSSEQFTSSSSSNFEEYQQSYLPLNVNDSQEMLLAGVMSEAGNHIKEEVYESLRRMEYDFKEGCSPVLVMKKRHSMNRKNALRKKMSKDLNVDLDDNNNNDNVLVFEDLGSDYLEELLGLSESITSSAP